MSAQNDRPAVPGYEDRRKQIDEYLKSHNGASQEDARKNLHMSKQTFGRAMGYDDRIKMATNDSGFKAKFASLAGSASDTGASARMKPKKGAAGTAEKVAKKTKKKTKTSKKVAGKTGTAKKVAAKTGTAKKVAKKAKKKTKTSKKVAATSTPTVAAQRMKPTKPKANGADGRSAPRASKGGVVPMIIVGYSSAEAERLIKQSRGEA